MNEQLWCVHIEGLGDFIAAASRDAAEHEASAINAYIAQGESSRRAAQMRAVAIEWPYTPASHARALEEDAHDLQRMPHRRAAFAAPRNALVNLARRVKELIAVVRSD